MWRRWGRYAVLVTVWNISSLDPGEPLGVGRVKKRENTSFLRIKGRRDLLPDHHDGVEVIEPRFGNWDAFSCASSSSVPRADERYERPRLVSSSHPTSSTRTWERTSWLSVRLLQIHDQGEASVSVQLTVPAVEGGLLRGQEERVSHSSACQPCTAIGGVLAKNDEAHIVHSATTVTAQPLP